MEILFKNELSKNPKVSLVLVDWSVRESVHVLRYLEKQTTPRDDYEIIWIEYYENKAKEITNLLDESLKNKNTPPIDQWINLNISKDIYYHKHLMYNIGLVLSRGDIVCILDSDAILSPSFIQNIIKEFEKNPNIVLHLDELRNESRKFYPFNYPEIKEIINEDCKNLKDGKTIGLLDGVDFLHTRNYDSCMCAKRKDLISIGGCDEHQDYLGYVSGPYDLTFRLINYGKKEVWSQDEFLYHVWHPGTNGEDNYFGSHDGKNISTIAIESIESKRIFPLKENATIKMLRNNKSKNEKDILINLIDKEKINNYKIDETKNLVSQGKEAFLREDYSTALEYWRKLNPKVIRTVKNLLNDIAWANYYTGQIEKAYNLFETCIFADKKDYNAYLGRGWVHLKKSNFDKAIVDFNTVLNSNSCKEKKITRELFKGLAWAYFHKNILDESLKYFYETLEYTEKNNKKILQDIYRGLSWIYIKKEDFRKAKNAVILAVNNIDDKDSLEYKDAMRAISFLESMPLDSLNKTETELLSEIGWNCYLNKSYSSSIKNFNKALEIEPNNYLVLYRRGLAYLKKCKFNKSMQDFNASLNNPECGIDENILQEIYRGKAWIYYHTGNFEEALKNFDKALEYTVNANVNALKNIYRGKSWIYFKMNDIDKAMELFKINNNFNQNNKSFFELVLTLQITASNLKNSLKKMFC
jgi:tetratricopeptide (TPR) repeat protein